VVELVVGSVVVDAVLLVVGTNDGVVVGLVVVVVATAVVASFDVAALVDGALASAPLHAASSTRAASRACFDVALRPSMRRRSYGATPSRKAHTQS
jgi:hypothetical protein